MSNVQERRLWCSVGQWVGLCSQRLGKGKEFLQTASGIELPMHDPRYAPGLARIYQYDPTPGRHVKGGLGHLQMLGRETGDKYNYSGTGNSDLELAAQKEVFNSLGFCSFGSRVSTQEIQKEYIEALTGIRLSDEDQYWTGLRIFYMRHAFNIREGIKPSDLTLSERAVGKPALKAGPLAGVTIDTELLARNFFEAAQWNMETGKPSMEILRKIGCLDKVIEDLYGAKVSV